MIENISMQWKISGQTLCFRASTSCSKFWMIKICIQYSEFRAHSMFQGKQKLLNILNVKRILNAVKIFRASASYSKFWMIKICIQQSEFREHSVFQGKRKLVKILKDKKYFNTRKNYRAKSVFRGKRKLVKILNDKKYIFNTVNSGHTLCVYSIYSIQQKISGQAQSYSKSCEW